MTLRQALAGQWQIPLFAIALACFGGLLWHLRPRIEKPTFEQRLERLEKLAGEKRYTEFFTEAEVLRQACEEERELGQVHGLVGQVRARMLRENRKLSVSAGREKRSRGEYESVIRDYTEAFRRGWKDPQKAESAEALVDLGLCYWNTNEADKAIQCYEKALSLREGFDPTMHQELVEMYEIRQPKGYEEKSMGHIESLLNRPESDAEHRGWAFVRKAKVLLEQGKEEAVFAMLEEGAGTYREGRYGEELDFLRARALRASGKSDEAELILRDLLQRTKDRGDLYAQTGLELGWINLEQYRDYEARRFFGMVAHSQIGQDWYYAAKLGLAECAAMQKRYTESLGCYQEVVEQLKENPGIRTVKREQVRRSLGALAFQLSLVKQYELALQYLEIERAVADPKDIRSAYAFAQMNAYRANQLEEQFRESEAAIRDREPSEQERAWTSEQKGLIARYYEIAAEQYLVVAGLIQGDDDLYGEVLWQGASCYDKSGNAKKTIESWLRFVKEREGHPRWPMGLYQLAQAYQSIGDYKQAILYYRRLRLKHPKSPSAFEAMIPLANCYLSTEPADTEEAERILQSVLTDRALTPEAPAYRKAMFVLGSHYYQCGKYADAIRVLTEAIDRYPRDGELGKSMFLVADSYRRNGLALNDTLKKLSEDPAATLNREKTGEQRREHLERAKEYFEKAIEFFQAIPEGRQTEQESMYLRQCYMCRADCLFDLERYREAAQLYEAAVMRYQLTPTALNAFVQIMNCQLQMGNYSEARFTNERAIWQLQKMPDAALGTGPGARNRQQWGQWFAWLGESGMW